MFLFFGLLAASPHVGDLGSIPGQGTRSHMLQLRPGTAETEMFTTPGGSGGKESPAMQETQVQSVGQEDPLEKGTATHSSILAWRIPRTEEPGRLTAHGITKSRTLLGD